MAGAYPGYVRAIKATLRRPGSRPEGLEARRVRFLFGPLENEGVERRQALGAGSARTLTVPYGHGLDAYEASRTQ